MDLCDAWFAHCLFVDLLRLLSVKQLQIVIIMTSWCCASHHSPQPLVVDQHSPLSQHFAEFVRKLEVDEEPDLSNYQRTGELCK